MKVIKLTRGLETKVSNRDFASLSRWKWQAIKSHSGKFYAVRNGLTKRNGKLGRHMIMMHRIIKNVEGLTAKIEVDHKNKDTLDNQRGNLRLCSHKENMRNMGKKKKINPKGSHPIYKGLLWDEKRKVWHVYCRDGKSKRYVGAFASSKDAAIAYNRYAKKYHGKFASLNPIT